MSKASKPSEPSDIKQLRVEYLLNSPHTMESDVAERVGIHRHRVVAVGDPRVICM